MTHPLSQIAEALERIAELTQRQQLPLTAQVHEESSSALASLRAMIDAPSDDLVERVARAIHERRSPIPWNVTINQDHARKDARAAISAMLPEKSWR